MTSQRRQGDARPASVDVLAALQRGAWKEAVEGASLASTSTSMSTALTKDTPKDTPFRPSIASLFAPRFARAALRGELPASGLDLLAATPSAAFASRYEALFASKRSLAELMSLRKKRESAVENGEDDDENDDDDDIDIDEEEEEEDRRAQDAEASRVAFETARGPIQRASVAIFELWDAVEAKRRRRKKKKKERRSSGGGGGGLFFFFNGGGRNRKGDAADTIAVELAAILTAAYNCCGRDGENSTSDAAGGGKATTTSTTTSLLPPLALAAELVFPSAAPEIAVSVALNVDGGGGGGDALGVVAAALARAASSDSASSASTSSPSTTALRRIASASAKAADAVLSACLSVRACPIASGALEIATMEEETMSGGGGGGRRAAALARAATVGAAADASASAGVSSAAAPSSAASWLASALSKAGLPESDAFVAALERDARSRGRTWGLGGDDDAGVAATARLLAAGCPPSRCAASAWASRIAESSPESLLGAPTRLAAASMLLLASSELEPEVRSRAFARILSVGGGGGGPPRSAAAASSAAAAAASSSWLSVLLLARAWGPLADGLRKRVLGGASSSSVRFSDAALSAAAADAADAADALASPSSFSAPLPPLAAAAEAAAAVPPTRGLAAAPSTLLFSASSVGGDEGLGAMAVDAVAVAVGCLPAMTTATTTTKKLSESVARHVACAGAPLHPSLVSLVEAAASSGLELLLLPPPPTTAETKSCFFGEKAVAAAERAASNDGVSSSSFGGAAVLASYHALLRDSASPSWPSPAEELPLRRLARAVACRGGSGGGGPFAAVRSRWLALADAVIPGCMPSAGAAPAAASPSSSLVALGGGGKKNPFPEGGGGAALAIARLRSAAAASTAPDDDTDERRRDPLRSPSARRLLSAVDSAASCLVDPRCPTAVSAAICSVSASLPPALARAARAVVLRACGCALPSSARGGSGKSDSNKRKRGENGESSTLSLADDAAALAAAPLLAFAPSPAVWSSPAAAEACLAAAVAVLSDARHAMRTLATAVGGEKENGGARQQQQQQRGGVVFLQRRPRPPPASFLPHRGAQLDAALAAVDGAALTALGEALAVVLRRAEEEEEDDEDDEEKNAADDVNSKKTIASACCCSVAASICSAVHSITLDSPHAPRLAAKQGGWPPAVARILVSAVPSLHVASDFAGQLALEPRTGGVGAALSTELASRWPTPATLAACSAALARGRAAADAGDAEAVSAVLFGAGRAAAALPAIAGDVAALAQQASNASANANNNAAARLKAAAERAVSDLAEARLGHGTLPL